MELEKLDHENKKSGEYANYLVRVHAIHPERPNDERFWLIDLRCSGGLLRAINLAVDGFRDKRPEAMIVRVEAWEESFGPK